MAPSINGNEPILGVQHREMQAEIATASCLTPIGPADMAVTLAQPRKTPLAGVSFSQTATVATTARTRRPASSSRRPPRAGLTIVAADAGGASCTVAASSATCALGTVGGGASRGVTSDACARRRAGTFDLTATVAADSDANANDNDDAVTVARSRRRSISCVGHVARCRVERADDDQRRCSQNAATSPRPRSPSSATADCGTSAGFGDARRRGLHDRGRKRSRARRARWRRRPTRARRDGHRHRGRGSTIDGQCAARAKPSERRPTISSRSRSA